MSKYPAEVNEVGWPKIARSVLGRIGKSERDVDHWLWTQVNRSTIEMVMESMGQPMEKAHTIMHKWELYGIGVPTDGAR